MKTLKIFGAVIAKNTNELPFVSKEGLVIESGALWAKDRIIEYYKNEMLNGEDLNKTFHKSWQKIKDSSQFELFLEQIQHYISTYGSNFEDEIYLPDEVLEIPDVKVALPVIKSYSKEEMTEKCLTLFKSGIALKEETIDDIISILVEDLGYQFTGKEGIKNKEAIIKIADAYNIIPSDLLEFFRYIIYRSTGQSLLIKNDEVIDAIKACNYNPSIQFNQFGLEKLAEIFNRFKPLFIAYKTKCPKVINRISKLSKKYHKPLVQNPLNDATNTLLSISHAHWLHNATPFALFKALSACYSRIQGQDSFVYQIRNGKSWTKENKSNDRTASRNFDTLLDFLVDNYSLEDKNFYLPEDVEYGLPTSEKMFVGNIPTGTKFFGEKLAVGIYWEDSWGARDLDLSGQNIGGKIGWNSSYNQGDGSLMYSGDITSAPHGAIEYLYANNGLKDPTLIKNNVYSGEDDCGYKIVIGKACGIHKDYMNPDHIFAEIKCESVQRQTILGMMLPCDKGQSFVLLNFGAGHTRVSGDSEISGIATKALYQKWNKPFSFNELLVKLGAKIVNDPKEADFDLDLNSLNKNSFTDIFK